MPFDVLPCDHICQAIGNCSGCEFVKSSTQSWTRVAYSSIVVIVRSEFRYIYTPLHVLHAFISPCMFLTARRISATQIEGVHPRLAMRSLVSTCLATKPCLRASLTHWVLTRMSLKRWAPDTFRAYHHQMTYF